jgi:uncharacterized protein (DUF1810 family)
MNRHAGRGSHPGLTANTQHNSAQSAQGVLLHRITTGRYDECTEPNELSPDCSGSEMCAM